MSCGIRRPQYRTDDIISPKDSLLKYEVARLLVTRDLSDSDYKKVCRSTIFPSFKPTPLYDTDLNLLDPYTDSCRPADILDFLFPPVEFIDKFNHKHILCVSRHPATKNDVHRLEMNLDRRLQLDNALEVGLCVHRRTIYDECFDELVRQVTIECGERGILLARVRDTFRRMMHDYLSIYISANAYAMRTFLLNEQAKIQLIDQIDRLEFEIEQRQKELIDAEDRLETILEMCARFSSSNEQRYPSNSVEIPMALQQLRTVNKALKQELEYVLLKKLKLYVPEMPTRKILDRIETIQTISTIDEKKTHDDFRGTIDFSHLTEA